MQRISTKVFIVASVAFGIVGILFAVTLPRYEEPQSGLNHFLFVLLASIGFVILSSFAVSVATKYLSNDELSD